MRFGGRRVLSVVAIYAIALHTIFWAAGPAFAGPSTDPFSVICHSEAPSPSDQAPGNPASTPSQVCDHCNLCSATPAPPVSFDSVLAGILTPTKLRHVLAPAIAAPNDGIADNPNRTRGPPQLT
jgi:hypothetical protein